jgi:hypothetical protein
VHSLSAPFILGYHGCDRETGGKLLQNARFRPSENSYDWLGSGIYFWEANPDRALDWAMQRSTCKSVSHGIETVPFVVGTVIDLGFCLDLISANGSQSVEKAYTGLQAFFAGSNNEIPANTGGEDLLHRKLDCMVLNFLHEARLESNQQPFDTVRAVFTEGEPLYPTAGFRRKTHIQICVRNSENIKGVFRVPDHHFTQDPL